MLEVAGGEVAPSGHGKQSKSVVRPVRSLYLPATQSVHVEATDAPFVVEYLPAPQSRHVVSTDAPTVVEYFPAAQSVQSALPAVAAEYLPAAQSMQVASTDAPTVVEYLPAAQSRHVVATEAPTVVEYLPAAQSVHVEKPVVVEYFPAGHCVHELCDTRIIRELLKVQPEQYSYHPVLPFKFNIEVSDPHLYEYTLLPQSELPNLQKPVVE